MALSTQPYKGARDFYPEDKRLQNYIFNTMRRVARSYGYEEYDAPILEPTELFLAKGNQEIIEEQTYTFADRGGRNVTVRTEMTPSVSRMVAGRRQELAYPLRWFSIPNLWRYERMQRGRLREFWQLNLDIFGVEGVQAEHEVICYVADLMKAYGAKPTMYSIRINSRALMDYLMRDYLGLDEVQAGMLARLIDRMHKMSAADFTLQLEALLNPTQRDGGLAPRIVTLLQAKQLSDLPPELRSQPACLQLLELMELLAGSGVINAEFDITIMRGFDYYTGIVFEVMDTDPENNRAMSGGGRYDGLVGQFGVEPVPTVGFGFGDVTLQNFLESHNLMPRLISETNIYIVQAGDVYAGAAKVARQLREENVNVAIDTSGRKMDKQFKSAVKKGIRYALIIGDAELADGRYKLKDLVTGNEQTHSLERITSIVLKAYSVYNRDDIDAIAES